MFKRLVMIGLLVISMAFSNRAFAAPSVNPISVTLNHGQTITISGNSFGTHPRYNPSSYTWHGSTYLPAAFKDFEDNSTSSQGFSANNLSGVTLRDNGPANSTRYLTTTAIGTRLTGYGINQSTNNTSSIYTSFWYMQKSGNQGGKPWRWYFGPNSSNDNLYLATTAGQNLMTMQGDMLANAGQGALWGGGFSANVWHKLEIYASEPNQAYQVWLDGVIYLDFRASKGVNPWSYPHTMSPNGHTMETPDMSEIGDADVYSYDDIYIDYTPARVEICNGSTWSNRGICNTQIPTNWSTSSINIVVNKGTFASVSNKFLYVVDNANAANYNGIAVTFGGSSSGGSTPTDQSPTVAISSPTASSTYTTTSNSINLAGSAGDDYGISSVTWRNSLTGNSGTATYSSGSWSVSGIALQSGTNAITVTARDTAGQTATDTLSITYTASTGGGTSTGSSDIVWDAESNIGGGQWYNSGVTYCARILIPGSQITRSGDTIKLGFQGRSSGDYRIKSVSIAQRDSNGNLGNVVDSTWTKVTFDKKGEVYHDILSGDSWENYNVTVPQGAEKISNPIRFNIIQGQDYYVTFKIVTPSVYQNPPAGYSELYFESADHTQDKDWSGTGFSTTQDYHALSNIYITTEMTSPNMQ